MKSTLKRWGLACALAISVCMSFMWGIASTAAVTVRGVYRVVRDAVMVRWGRFTDLLKSPAPSAERPASVLVQAKAYAANLIKRDRPRVTPDWRLCPSI